MIAEIVALKFLLIWYVNSDKNTQVHILEKEQVHLSYRERTLIQCRFYVEKYQQIAFISY